MTDFVNTDTVLERIYAVGEQLRTVLEGRDVEAFVQLVEERGALVERLHGLERPTAPVPTAWRERAALLKKQYTDVMAEASVQQQQLADAQGVLNQVRQAKARYSNHRTPPRFLNKNLSG